MRYLLPLLLLLFLLPAVFGTARLAAEDSGQTFDRKRKDMVEKTIKARGIRDQKVINAMEKVKRHLFVEPGTEKNAYEDHPLPIGEGQTISQPYVVALMTEALALTGSEKILEIGTGSGYQAAILGEVAREVFTIEIKKGLSRKAEERLRSLGYRNVHAKYGDGYFGWEENAPFDAIMVTASANHIPPPLLAQLKEGGKLIIPLGSTIFYQNLTLVTKTKGKFVIKELASVAFVPMTGEIQKK